MKYKAIIFDLFGTWVETYDKRAAGFFATVEANTDPYRMIETWATA